MIRQTAVLTALTAALLTGGCRADDGRDDATAGDATVGDAQPQGADAAQPVEPAPTQPQNDMRLEVNLGARELYVYRDGRRVETHPVAVGSSEWPTPTGEWTIGQVVFNPEWIPPDEEWARDEERKEPGDPENPLGRAQLVYSPPNTVHGTNDPSSLGRAVSHGSIRVSNEVAVRLARQVMEAGGASRDEGFFQSVQADSSRRESVNIPNPVPIRVVAGAGS